MFSDALDRAFNRASQAYRTAVCRPELPATDRLAAAARFLDLSEVFETSTGIAFLGSQLAARDSMRRNTAARLLSDMYAEAAAATLTGAYLGRDRRWLKPAHLVRSAERVPLQLPPGVEPEKLPAGLRATVVRALLARDTVAARERLWRVLGGADALDAEVAVDAVGRWCDPSLLGQVLDHVDRGPRSFERYAVGIRAATRLAVLGEDLGITWLQARAEGDETLVAALASKALGLVAWPGAVPLVEHLLDHADGEALTHAVDAADHLSAGALMPALVDVVRRYADEPTSGPHANVSDVAIRVLERMTGRWVPVELTSYDDRGNYDVWTRLRSALLHQSIASDYDPALRWVDGEPLSVRHLVDQLTSPHRPHAARAAMNLAAITSEFFGFDADEDLIGNLPAIEGWRRRNTLRGDAGLPPGHWAWRGEAVVLAPLLEAARSDAS